MIHAVDPWANPSSAYFSQGTESEKSKISTSFRFTENFGGKFLGKLFAASVYLPWFMGEVHEDPTAGVHS